MTQAQKLYFKLQACLDIAMSNEKLSCHVNDIVKTLAKSINSDYEWYDAMKDAWCDYFLSMNKKGEKDESRTHRKD